MALLNNQKNILPLSSISELLNTKTRTLKMYEEKLLLPLEKDKTIKKLYSIDDIKIIAFVHYLATIKKINSNGILYILEIIEDNMDLKHKQEFLKIIEKKLTELKDYRNALAHGNDSFADIGSKVTFNQMVDYKDKTFKYLDKYIATISTYVSDKKYRVSYLEMNS